MTTFKPTNQTGVQSLVITTTQKNIGKWRKMKSIGICLNSTFARNYLNATDCSTHSTPVCSCLAIPMLLELILWQVRTAS